ncbi:hypothetical protein BD779DRAFT_1680727 [Infundibulicybe gibba]|nr:hypothetical protein BD779DRAFT_1680727 [Infundibulicybe gibba]
MPVRCCQSGTELFYIISVLSPTTCLGSWPWTSITFFATPHQPKLWHPTTLGTFPFLFFFPFIVLYLRPRTSLSALACDIEDVVWPPMLPKIWKVWLHSMTISVKCLECKMIAT